MVRFMGGVYDPHFSCGFILFILVTDFRFSSQNSASFEPHLGLVVAQVVTNPGR